jgi:peptide/nickel transport system ATP-binding protein
MAILGLVGESGAGKSMIGRAIAKLLPPSFEITAGSLLFEGENLLQMPPSRRRALLGRALAFIPQQPMTALNPVMTIAAQFDEHLARLGEDDRKRRRERAISMLAAARLRRPADILPQYPHQLSGGMCQHVLIALAFSSNPRLVIADEPTTALDVTMHPPILRLIAEMQRQHGTAVIFITHDLRLAAQLCDQIVVMYAGRSIESGPARSIMSKPAHPYTRCLQLANPTMHGARREAVKDASFSVAENEFVALVGESGSGKSTIAKLLVGLEQTSSGRILLNGEDLTDSSLRRDTRRAASVQMVFQDPQSALNPRRRVASIITQAMEAGTRHATWEGRLKRTGELLAEIGLAADFATRLPGQLSGGQRQRVNIGRALCNIPKILIADEIVSGLDVSIQAQLLNLLARLRSELGFAMLFISHDLSVVRHLCSRVLVMYRGEIVEQGPVETVFTDPQHPHTRALLSSVPPDDPQAPWPALKPAG